MRTAAKVALEKDLDSRRQALAIWLAESRTLVQSHRRNIADAQWFRCNVTPDG